MSRQVIIANFYLKMSTTVTVLYRHFYVCGGKDDCVPKQGNKVEAELNV
jgi:hypothetical protein